MQWLNIATRTQSKWIVKGLCDVLQSSRQQWNFYLQGLSCFCRCDATEIGASPTRAKWKALESQVAAERWPCKDLLGSDVPLHPSIHGGSCTNNTAATNITDRSVIIAIHFLSTARNTSAPKVCKIFLSQRTQTDTIRKFKHQATSFWIPFFPIINVV